MLKQDISSRRVAVRYSTEGAATGKRPVKIRVDRMSAADRRRAERRRNGL
jgi:hypothetical protein